MIYRNLGNSGLQVSVIGFGTWTNLQTPYEQMKSMIQICIENGVNLFDLAESYGEGAMEEKVGKILEQIGTERERLVISTKIWKGHNPEINSQGNTNRKHIKEGLNQSLKRLRMQYVDIVMAHKFDSMTPLEEICKAFNDVIEDGLAFYWGVSNWEVTKIFEAIGICEKNKWHLPIATQSQYNMIYREQVELSFRSLLLNYKFGLMAYSPLMGGYLTGKYLDNQHSQGRFSDSKTSDYSKEDLAMVYLKDVDLPKVNRALLQIRKIAEEQMKCTLAQLAIAWSIKFKYTSSALIGARNCKQLDNTFECLRVLEQLDDKLEGRINKILGTQPDALKLWSKGWDCEAPFLRVLEE